MAYEAMWLLESVGGDPGLAGSAMARAAAQEAIEDAAEERQAEQRRAAAEERRETLAVLDRQFGGAQEQIRHLQAGISDQADAVADLESKLERARARLESSRSSLAWWSERLLLAQEGTQRSTPPDAVEQASARAQDALRQVREGRMVLERAKRSVRQRFGGSAPAAVLEARSESAGGPHPGGSDVRIRNGGHVIGWWGE
jgi:chromosome segregation ATPase